MFLRDIEKNDGKIHIFVTGSLNGQKRDLTASLSVITMRYVGAFQNYY